MKILTLTLAGLLVPALAAGEPGRTGAQPSPVREDAAEILAAADRVRLPPYDHAVEAEVRAVLPDGMTRERTSAYTVVTRPGAGAVLLRQSADLLRGSAVLLAGGEFWQAGPGESSPAKMGDPQLLASDFAGLAVLRQELSPGWSARIAREERYGGDLCWQLELVREGTAEARLFARVLYWIRKDDRAPRRMELYGGDGTKLLRMARFERIEEEAGERYVAKAVVEGETSREDLVTLSLSPPRRVDAGSLRMTPEGLAAFRKAARSVRSGRKDEASVRVELALAALGGPGNAPPQPRP